MKKAIICIDGKDHAVRPCPFCGNRILQLREHEPDGIRMFTKRFSVLCNWDYGGCGAESGYYYSPEEAIDIWNRRARK